MGIKKKRNGRKPIPAPPQRVWTQKKKYPGGVIPADSSKQAPNGSYSAPWFYQDRQFNCRDCGVSEVWTAEQQWVYFEVWRKPIYGDPVRCRDCRKKLREARKLQRERSIEGAAKKKARLAQH